jgi:hypothetical protein
MFLSSFTKDQNEGVVERFLSTHDDAGPLNFVLNNPLVFGERDKTTKNNQRFLFEYGNK